MGKQTGTERQALQMKQAKKPTREQKEILSNNYLNWKDWAVIKDGDFRLTVIHKETGRVKFIDKFARRKR